MKSIYLYEIKMLDGSRYQGEIAYRDDKMVVLRLSPGSPRPKLRLYSNGIVSIRDLGWRRAYSCR